MNVRLRRSLDVISGRPQDVRLGRPRDGQIGSLGDVLGTLEGDVLGTSWGPIFAGWTVMLKNYSFHNFLNRSHFAFLSFQKKTFYLKKCLYYGTYLNSTSKVFAYLPIIFLVHNWFGCFLNKRCIRSTPQSHISPDDFTYF